MDKNNSPLQWLLGTSSFVWGILVDNVPVNLDSGLTKPKTYALYGQLAQNEKEAKVDLSDYLSGLTVKAGSSEPISVYGDGAPIATSKFNLANNNNHYAIDMNAKELTGGTLTALCAVILRSEKGISGIKAYTNIASMVDVTLDFGTYVEGVTEVYGGKVLSFEKATVNENGFLNDYVEATGLTAEEFTNGIYYVYDKNTDSYVEAEDYRDGVRYFKKVNTRYYLEDGTLATEFVAGTQYYEYIEKDSDKKLCDLVAVRNYLAYVTETYKFDRNHTFTNNTAHINSIFGCYFTKDGSYASSDVLETIYLDVYAGIGATTPERTLKVLYSSTVLLVSDFPEFADANKESKLIYVNADGKDLGKSMIIDDSVIVYVDGVGRVSVYKDSREAVEVVLNFVGISGMKPVSAAFAYGEKLNEYVLNDYSFLGWYKEESFVTKVETVSEADVVGGKITLYGKYVKSLIEAENGINYSFDTEVDGYFVSGVNKNISVYYNNADLWLRIASEINGYTVKYIAKEAFANSEDDTAHSLVRVLVPETVIAVYDNAFLNNKALKEVVFCADNVFFGGRADKNGTTSVFYGCYSGKASNNNAFTVYYNGTRNNPYGHVSTTDNALDSSWNRIYFQAASITNLWQEKKYTMNTQSGGWLFADYEINTDSIDLNEYPYLADLNLFNSGFESTGTVYTAEQIRNTVIAEINRRTAENGKFINAFEVNVSSGTRMGKYTLVNIEVVAAPAPAYEINYDLNCNAYVSGAIEFNGKYYATAGEKYLIVPNDGYEIASINGIEYSVEDGQYYFIMPYEVTEIDIICQKMAFTQVKLISDIAFNFEGVGYDSTVTVDGREGDAMVNMATAQSGEYVFVGWAYKVSETSFVLEGATINYNVYYAIWAYKRTEIASLSSDGSTLTAKVNSGADSVYGWYASSDFSGEALAICANSTATFTTVSSTIMYARLVYAYSYAMTGKWSGTNKYYVNEDNSQSATSDQNGSFRMLEGTQLKYSWDESEDAGKILKVDFVNENGVSKTLYFKIVYGTFGLNPQINAITLGGSVTNADVTNRKSIIVESNLSMTIKL